jgi:hypothetical protein
MTKPTLKTRQAAGERYAAAVAELHAALAELAVMDSLVGGDDITKLTFGAWQPEALPDLRHREFVPTVPKIRELVAERRAELLEAVAG